MAPPTTRTKARSLTDAEQRTWRAFRESARLLFAQLDRDLSRDAGMAARLELEAQFGGNVFLDLNVKAFPGWREDPRFLSELTS